MVSKYIELTNKEWLYQKYIVEKLSTKEIQVILRTKYGGEPPVHYFLTQHNIATRDRGEGHWSKRDDIFVPDIDVLDGCILGDGCIKCDYKQKGTEGNPKFCKRNKYKDHIELVAKILLPVSWQDRVHEGCNYLYGRGFSNFYFDTLTRKELWPFYKRWYPEENNFVKVVPKDASIAPKSLLHWFLDDGTSAWGSSTRSYKPNNKRYVNIRLYVNVFKENDLNILRDRINDKYDIDIVVKDYWSKTQKRSYYYMRIPSGKAEKFYSIIGPPPIESLSYKWKEGTKKYGTDY